MPDQLELELYYWPTPNGWKVSIMLEELGWPYKLNYVNIGKGDQFKPDFLKISPNNRMPAIIDPQGPDGEPVSVFESGAILQYLARKSGRFCGESERERIQVDEWLFWQMGGLGPMAGQAHHFRIYAQEQVPYAIERYTNEVNRLYGVLNKRLEGRSFIVDSGYTIADMASIGWATLWERQGQDMDQFSNVKAWIDRCRDRPATVRGLELGLEKRKQMNFKDDKKQAEILFSQKA